MLNSRESIIVVFPYSGIQPTYCKCGKYLIERGFQMLPLDMGVMGMMATFQISTIYISQLF